MSEKPQPVVVIDPGHGGSAKVGGSSHNNATGPNGLLEKDLTLDIARRVETALRGYVRVILTRTGDTNLGLAARAQVARDNNAALFLSIHLNGFSDTSVDGTETWIARTNPNQLSRDFAATVQREVVAVTGVRDRGVRQEDFGVLLASRHAAHTGAALVEVAFLTNPAQARQLESTAYRDRIAAALATAVRAHIAVPAAVGHGMDYGYGYGSYDDAYGSYALRDIAPDYRGVRSVGDSLRALKEWTERTLRFYVGVEDPTFMPHSSICQLKIKLDTGATGTGTGFYISPNRILTAGHNIKYGSANATSIVVWPGRHYNMSTFPEFRVEASSFVKHPSYVFGNPDFDLAVIKVTTPPPNGSVFAIEELRFSPGSGIVVCGYASGGARENQQHMDVDSIRDLDTESFTYGLHTQGGTSGSPVFYSTGSAFCAVGVHHGGNSLSNGDIDPHTNRGCRLTDDKVRWIRSI